MKTRGIVSLLFSIGPVSLVLSMLVVSVQAREGEAASSEASAMRGKISYSLYCVSCHGKGGKGDGSVAEVLKIPPADLTCISARQDGEFPFEEIHRIVDGSEKGVRAHGGEMPVWGDAFMKTEETEDASVIDEKIRQLVHYLKSLQQDDCQAEGE